MSTAVVLIGAPGSGKSSVLDALSTILEAEGTPFGALETEAVARGWPWLEPPQWLPMLAALSRLQREAGRNPFVVAATPESDDELRAVIDAIGAETTFVVCLNAPADVVASRVAAREPDAWPGKPALIAHSRELADVIPNLGGIDAAIETDGRTATEVAGELRALLADRGLL